MSKVEEFKGTIGEAVGLVVLLLPPIGDAGGGAKADLFFQVRFDTVLLIFEISRCNH